MLGCIPDTINNLDELSGKQLRSLVMDCYDRIRKDIEDDIKLLNKCKRKDVKCKRKDAPGSRDDDINDDVKNDMNKDVELVDLTTPVKKKQKRKRMKWIPLEKSSNKQKIEFCANQAKKMAQQYDKNVQRRIDKVGDIASIGIDKRDIPEAHGVQAICFQRAEEGGGILAATTLGIIATTKKTFWIPLERYGVLVNLAPLSTEMRMLHVSILQGTYGHLNQQLVTLQNVHQELYETREDNNIEEEGKEKETVSNM